MQVVGHELAGNKAYLWIVIGQTLQFVDYGLAQRCGYNAWEIRASRNCIGASFKGVQATAVVHQQPTLSDTAHA